MNSLELSIKSKTTKNKFRLITAAWIDDLRRPYGVVAYRGRAVQRAVTKVIN